MKVMKLAQPLIVIAFLFFLVASILGQDALCSLGTVKFACPKHFKPVKTSDEYLRIFKYTGEGDPLFFFVTTPSSGFDPARVGDAVQAFYPKSDRLSWKTVTDPLVMNTKTKYKYDLIASMALGSSTLFEVKAFLFEFQGKKLVLGYVSDWSGNVESNRQRFAIGKAIGDHAAGCNAVVTTLNSITNEFKERNQYCFFTALSSSE